MALAIAPSNPNTLYVSIQDAINNVGNDSGLLGLFRTDNAWDPAPGWSRIPTGAIDDGSGIFGYCGWNKVSNTAHPQCWYNHKILVDPANSDTLYAAGVSLWRCTRCTAASAAWNDINSTRIHGDQDALAWAGSRLIVGNDGGVWSTADVGGTWNNHNTHLAITQFYYGSLHPTNLNFALGGSQDNGIEKWTGTRAWTLILSADGSASAISASNPSNNWAVSGWRENLAIFRTTNGGASFAAADAGIDKTGVLFIA